MRLWQVQRHSTVFIGVFPFLHVRPVAIFTSTGRIGVVDAQCSPQQPHRRMIAPAESLIGSGLSDVVQALSEVLVEERGIQVRDRQSSGADGIGEKDKWS